MKFQKIKVGLVQMDVGADKDDNLKRAVTLVEKAARRGAQFVCLPELFSYMGSFKNPRSVAEAPNGPSIVPLKSIAKKYRVYIVAGSVLTRKGLGLPLNACSLIGPDGSIVSKYSKMHLFDINIPGKIKFLESKFMQPGKHAVVADTKLGKVGFAICNDLRYPELFRKMIQADARCIFVPSAFTKFTGRDHWLALTRVRAIENQCYIVAVNQSGKNVDGVRFFGSSLVADPWGKVLVEGPPNGDAVLTCELDITRLETLRRQLPTLKKIRKRIPTVKISP